MKTNLEWAEAIIEKINQKISRETARSFGMIPYIPENGRYGDKGQEKIAWWTNGFYSGMLWQLYHYTHDSHFSVGAMAIEERLDLALQEFVGLHHDVGFMWLHTAVADYRVTGNEESKNRGLHAATLLAGRFNLRGKFIRSWNLDKTGWVIIDSMMNLPLLYWASQETGDPRFQQIAETHADTVMATMIREDGSVAHVGVFDAATGQFDKLLAGQGYSAESAWSRGQAWAIYGFALSYKYTGNKRYLDCAKKIANYFIANISETAYISLVDFRGPKEPLKWDTSAGLCAACGFLELVDHLPVEEQGLYQRAAVKILRQTEEKFANWKQDEAGIIGYSSHSYHQVEETHVPIIYADYFFTEGVLRLLNKELTIW